MLAMPDKIAERMKSLQKKIKESDLAGDGLESEYHVTVKYGLTSNELAEVEGAFPKGPVEIEFGKVSRFDSSPDFDVIKIEVFGDELFEAHLELSELPSEDSHAGFYRGHATLGYVKKNACSELDGNDEFDGERVMLDTLIWSPAEGDKKEIKLGQKKESWLRHAEEELVEQEEFQQDSEPQEDDVVIVWESGKLRAYQGSGRYEIALAYDRDLLELKIHLYMQKNGFFPNVWEDGSLYRLEPIEKLRESLAFAAKGEIIAGLEYFGPEPVGADDLVENIDKNLHLGYDYPEELRSIFDSAIQQLAAEGKVKQQGDGWIIPPKPSQLSDFNPASLPTMRPKDKQVSTDNLLDQYGDADPEERALLEQRMRELNASHGRWLRVEADLEARIPLLIKQFFPEVSEERARATISSLAQADPTGDQAKYITWLVKNHRGSARQQDDLEMLKNMLSTYEKIKNVKGFPPELKDINRLNYATVMQAVEKYQHLRPKNEQERELMNTGQKVVYNDSVGKIIVDHNSRSRRRALP